MLKNNKKHLEYLKRWREKNSEYRKKYYQANKEKEKRNNIEWRRKNIRKWSEYMRENFGRKYQIKTGYYKKWINENREIKNWHTKRRRALRASADGIHEREEWEELKKKYNYTCPACGRKEPEIKLTEDHIIPLSEGGSDYIENIQPLCRSCNSKKRKNVFHYNPVVNVY